MASLYKILNKDGDVVFGRDNNGHSLTECFKALQLMINGEKTTIQQAIDYGYQIVGA